MNDWIMCWYFCKKKANKGSSGKKKKLNQGKPPRRKMQSISKYWKQGTSVLTSTKQHETDLKILAINVDTLPESEKAAILGMENDIMILLGHAHRYY